MNMPTKDQTIIGLSHQIAQLRLELLQTKSQYEMARGISNRVQHERADLAQKLYLEHGLVLMPGGIITKREG